MFRILVATLLLLSPGYLFAQTPKGSGHQCSYVLLSHKGTVRMDIPMPKRIADKSIPADDLTWSERVFRKSNLFSEKESITFHTEHLANGFFTDAERFTNAIDEMASTAEGRYVLQFTIRLSKAAGKSHGVNEEDAEDIAGTVFLSIINAKHPWPELVSETGMTANEAPLTSAISIYGDMHFDYFMSLQTWRAYTHPVHAKFKTGKLRPEQNAFSRFSKGQKQLQKLLRGTDIRKKWNKSTELFLMGMLALKQSYPFGASQVYALEPACAAGPTLKNEWDARLRWEEKEYPVIALQNLSDAFDPLKTYLAEATWVYDEILGGLLRIKRAHALERLRESEKFMADFETYFNVLKGSERTGGFDLPPTEP